MKIARYISKILFTILILMICAHSVVIAVSESQEYGSKQIFNEQYDNNEIKHMQDNGNKLIDNQNTLFDDLNGDSIKEFVDGKIKFDPAKTVRRITNVFFGEINASIGIAAQFLIISLLISLIRALQDSFSSQEISEIAFFTCYMIIIGIALKAFIMSYNLTKLSIDNMVFFTQASLPVIFVLMISSNPLNSVNVTSMFSPSLLYTVQITAFLVKNFLIPLVLTSIILSTIDNLSDRYKITSLVNLIRNIVKWTMEAVLIGFAAICAVQGVIFKVSTTVGSKTLKFAVGNFVPIVGRALGESMELVMSCTSKIKDSIGLFGILIIISIGTIPILKILAQKLIFHITAAIVEPISDKKIVYFINDIAKSLTLLFILILICQIVFLMGILLVISIN